MSKDDLVLCPELANRISEFVAMKGRAEEERIASMPPATVSRWLWQISERGICAYVEFGELVVSGIQILQKTGFVVTWRREIPRQWREFFANTMDCLTERGKPTHVANGT